MVTRREFIDGVAVSAASMALSATTLGTTVETTAKSYARIAGANERLNFAVIGLNSRAYAHL